MVLQKVYAFGSWFEVLSALGLQPAPDDYRQAVASTAKFRGGGESKEHEQLKEYVSKNPHLVGAKPVMAAQIEYLLPSGDSVDVLFRERRNWIGVEVKSRLSPESDLVRGVFQCVKYRAVSEAVQAVEKLPRNARTVLVLEQPPSPDLVALKNLLGVEVRTL